MSASVTLARLCWSTPDGTAVLSDLDFTFGAERTGLVGRNGSGKTTLMRLIAGELTPRSGHVQITGSLGVLRQDILADPSETVADLFGVTAALELLDRADAGQAGIEDLAAADWTLLARMEAALHHCGLEVDPGAALGTLSGGQRTRAGLAALLFAEPDILMLDEPTNNLDRAGRAAVAEVLRGWRQTAIVVSHDRELLEEMDAIVELGPLGARRYGGPYSAYRSWKAGEIEAAQRDLLDAEKRRAEQARRAQQTAERKARRDGRGRRNRAGGGQPKILLDAAKERAEGSGGASARLHDDRRRAAEGRVAKAREKVEVIDPLTMQINPTGLAPSRRVLRLEAISGGHDTRRPIIRDFSLTMTGPERVAITGANGRGKTTLLDLIVGRLAPVSGRVVPGVASAYLDQTVSLLAPEQSLRDNFQRLNPAAPETECRAALARFRFRAEDALRRAGTLSGGERLRAGLACTIGRADPPAFLILDEPTNHLDLDGLAALEAALNAYDGALLVVSHDETFLARLGLQRRIEIDAETPNGRSA